MCPKRNLTEVQRRRPSPSGMTIEELNSSELVALLDPAEASSPTSNSRSWAQDFLSTSLPIPFVVITFVIATLFAFTIGCVARMQILNSHGPVQPVDTNMMSLQVKELLVNKLPAPTILPGKEVPYTTYTSKHFQMPGSSTSNTLHIDRSSAIQQEHGSYAPGERSDVSSGLEEMNEHDHNSDESGEHLPAGQHLLRKYNTYDGG